MGELGVARGAEGQDLAVSTVYVRPGAGSYGAFQPGAAMAMSYDDLKVIEVHGFLSSVADGGSWVADVDDAVRAAVVLDACTESVTERRWVDLPAL
jgi:predicted dehydrogenase